jgi:hypothetical protein
MGAQKSHFDINDMRVSAEFVIDSKKREELLIARIYRLSYILTDDNLEPEQEEQIKLILEDALAELDILNDQSQTELCMSKSLFH